MPEHVFYTEEDIKDKDGQFYSMVVEGGLAICKKCMGMEGSLTTDCPEKLIGFEDDQRVYRGEMDYKDGKGWVPEKNPNNLSWIYGRWVRFYGTDLIFCTKEKISPIYFENDVKKQWKEWKWPLTKLEKRS